MLPSHRQSLDHLRSRPSPPQVNIFARYCARKIGNPTRDRDRSGSGGLSSVASPAKERLGGNCPSHAQPTRIEGNDREGDDWPSKMEAIPAS